MKKNKKIIDNLAIIWHGVVLVLTILIIVLIVLFVIVSFILVPITITVGLIKLLIWLILK